MSRIPSYKDIAAHAGVSQMSVSLALRDDPSLPVTTRRRIQRIAEQIGYTRDPRVAEIMGYLRRRRAKKDQPVLAFLNVWARREEVVESYFLRHFLSGASARAAELGFRVEQFWLRGPGMNSTRLSNVLEARGIHGLILPMLPPGQRTLSLRWEAFTTVAVSLNAHGLGLHHVCSNRLQTMELTLAELQRRTYRRIGLVLDEDMDERSRHQFIGHFYWAQSRLASNARVPVLVGPEYDRRSFAAWLEREKPDVVISPHAPLLGWLRDLGLRVPAAIGFASLSTQADRPDGVSGVDERPTLIGIAAIDQLTSQVQRNERGLPTDRRHVLVEGIWVPGRTLRPAPALG